MWMALGLDLVTLREIEKGSQYLDLVEDEQALWHALVVAES